MEAYREGVESIESGDVLYAAKKFNEAETLFPQSIWAPKSALMAAYAYYIQDYYGDALAELERVMQKKFKDNTSLRASQVGGVQAAAKIMNFTKQQMESRIMKSLSREDKNLMQLIQENMFVFDNLIMADDKSLQTLLRNVDTELLVLSLKGADEPLREKIFSCMSTRAAANIQDEMGAMGPVRLTEVQEAQKQIINVARRLSDEGTIVLAGRGGDDFV